ncbi:MAG: hypothetical protein U9Q81_26120 [Pseudomonadota bacterium]|nr:hypothetical protein [Pseudomonadota bacterium]
MLQKGLSTFANLKSLLDPVFNWFGFLIRWLFILFLFVYLLALVSTLFEAHGFQQFVAKLIVAEGDAADRASETRKREVLLAVRAASDRLESGQVREGLYDQIAARLDSLYGATAAIISVTGSFVAQQDEKAAIRAGQQYAKLVRDLEGAATSIQDQLAEQEVAAPKPPDPAEVGADSSGLFRIDRSALRNLRDAFGQLENHEPRVVTASVKPPSRPNGETQPETGETPAEEAAVTQTKVQAEIIESYRNAMAALAAVVDSMKFAVLKSSLEDLQAELDVAAEGAQTLASLDDKLAHAGMVMAVAVKKSDAAPDGGETAKRRDDDRAILLSSSKRSIPDGSLLSVRPTPIEDDRVPLIRFWLNQAGVLDEGNLDDPRYDRAVADGVRAFLQGERDEGKTVRIIDDQAAGEFRTLMNAWIQEQEQAGRYRFTDGGDSNEETSGKNAEETAEDRGTDTHDRFRDKIAEVRDRLDEIRFALLDRGQDLQAARAMSRPLSDIKAAALALGTITLKASPRSAQAGPDQRTPDQIYQQETENLRNAISEIEKVLDQDLSPDHVIAEAIGHNVPNRYRAARAIWRAYVALGDYQSVLTPLAVSAGTTGDTSAAASSPADKVVGEGDGAGFWHTLKEWVKGLGTYLKTFGFNAQRIATSGTQILDLLVIFVMGAIGSLIFITKRQLKLVMYGLQLSSDVSRSFAWYVFRPIFGVIVAFALFLLYKAGQIALGAGTVGSLSSDVNLPILSILALFAGLLAFQTLNMIESKGAVWIDSMRRVNLYAPGLQRVLSEKDVQIGALATHVGATDIQVERWMASMDMVTPEMQDRILTWLDVRRDQVFSDRKFGDSADREPRVAKGLADAMARQQIDDAGLAELLGTEADRVTRWREQELLVPPAMQRRLAEVLKTTHSQLFGSAADAGAEGRWAVGLRRLMADKKITSDQLAERIDCNPKTLRDWMELAVRVPKDRQEMLEAKLEPAVDIFSAERPSTGRWALHLRARMADAKTSAESLARAIDTDPDRVRDWREMVPDTKRGRVAAATQAAIAQQLGVEQADLFGDTRPEAQFRTLEPTVFSAAAKVWHTKEESDQDVYAALASVLDVVPELIQRWSSGKEAVAPETAKVIKQMLGAYTKEESLFRDTG